MDTATRVAHTQTRQYRVAVNGYATPTFFMSPELVRHKRHDNELIAAAYRQACEMLHDVPAGAVVALVEGEIKLSREDGEVVFDYPQGEKNGARRVVPFKGEAVDNDNPDRYVVSGMEFDATPVDKLRMARALFRKGYAAAAYAMTCEMLEQAPAGVVPLLVESPQPPVQDLGTPDGALEFYYSASNG